MSIPDQMRNSQDLLVQIYRKTLSKYQKLRERFHKKQLQKSGNTRQQTELYRLRTRLKKLQQRLQKLSLQIKLGLAAGALALFLNANEVRAQGTIGPFERKDRTLNPLREPIALRTPSIALVDLDNDGDLDLVTAENIYNFSSGQIRYFENVGTNQQPLYQERTGTQNPFSSITTPNSASIAFADLDEDGDPDLFIGSSYNSIGLRYFRNDGGVFTEQFDPWNPVTKEGSPFYELGDQISYGYRPFFIDFDDDGDLDLFLAISYDNQGYGERLKYLENQGNAVFDFNGYDDTFNTTPPIPGGYLNAVYLADIDEDGELDLIVSYRYSSEIRFYRNIAGVFTEQTGPWDPITKAGNPFDDVASDLSGYVQPFLADLDNDGNLDLVVATGQSDKYNLRILRYYKNQGNFVLEKQELFDNPFDGLRIRNSDNYYNIINAVPVFIDVDNDGDMDLIIGGKYPGVEFGEIYFFENTPNGFVRRTGTENPFFGMLPSTYAYSHPKPTVVDLDGDGFDDIVVGTRDHVNLIRNNGDGTFTFETGASNPFDFVTSTFNYYAPAFIDIDNDGVLDMLLGFDDYITLWRNNGTNQNPNYVEDTNYNEFNSLNLYYGMTISIVDLDGDDLDDVVIGNLDYSNQEVYYFRNNGNETFTLQTSTQDPFYFIGSGNAMAFVDIDNDGDFDAFMAQQYIRAEDHYYAFIRFIRNENPPPVLNFSVPAKDYPNTGGAMVVDNLLTLNDDDSDQMIGATVRIVNYVQPVSGNRAEELTFTPGFGITGTFNESNGVLTLTGRAPVIYYQDVLRTVSYNMLIPSAVIPTGTPGVFSKNISMLVTDQDRTIGITANIALNVTIPNLPPVIGGPVSNLVYQVGNDPVVLTPALTISDPDDTELQGATVSISGFSNGDVLGFTLATGITGSYDSNTGVLNLSGNASLAAYQTVLRSVTFAYSATNPVTTTRIVNFVVSDGANSSNVFSSAISIISPPALSSTISPATFTLGQSPVLIASDLVITDDGTQISSATVQINGGNPGAGDVLSYNQSLGITGTFDVASGTLSFTTSALLSTYQQVLRSVAFSNPGPSTSLNARTISFLVNDGTLNSNTIEKIVPLNARPELSNTGSVQQYNTKGDPVTVAPEIVVSDPNDTQLQSAIVRISQATRQPGDVLNFDSSIGISGTFNAATRTLSFSGTASVQNYQQLLRSITFSNAQQSPNLNTRVIEFIVNDGLVESNLLALDLELIIINQPPQLSTTFIADDRLYSTGEEVVDGSITISDPDDAFINSATIRITQGFRSNQDRLLFNNQNGITGNYNNNTGVLSLSGRVALTTYQQALRSIRYRNTASQPNTETRTIEFIVNDGLANSNTLSVPIIFNLPPAIAQNITPQFQGNQARISLAQLISDPNNNLDLSTLEIVLQPISGAFASIDSEFNLIVDYTGISFSGTDRLRIRVCDVLGACITQLITIEVENEIQVFNGISPNNDGKNDYMEIRFIPPNNKVSIFNRWGDLVYDVEDYDNVTRRFEGFSNSGKELPAGVYFYKIEFASGRSAVTGYITIKR